MELLTDGAGNTDLATAMERMEEQISGYGALDNAQLYGSLYLGTQRALLLVADALFSGFAQLNLLPQGYEQAVLQLMQGFEVAFTAAVYDVLFADEGEEEVVAAVPEASPEE